jgi:hypothetical protein
MARQAHGTMFTAKHGFAIRRNHKFVTRRLENRLSLQGPCMVLLEFGHLCHKPFPHKPFSVRKATASPTSTPLLDSNKHACSRGTVPPWLGPSRTPPAGRTLARLKFRKLAPRGDQSLSPESPACRLRYTPLVSHSSKGPLVCP